MDWVPASSCLRMKNTLLLPKFSVEIKKETLKSRWTRGGGGGGSVLSYRHHVGVGWSFEKIFQEYLVPNGWVPRVPKVHKGTWYQKGGSSFHHLSTDCDSQYSKYYLIEKCSRCIKLNC